MSDDTVLLAQLAHEEETIQFRSFPNELALRIGIRLTELARERNLPIAIDITRADQQLFHCAMAGTTPDNAAWIRRKNRVVMRFGHSSLYVGVSYRERGTTIEERALVDPRKYAPHGGAFPIILAGTGVIGTVTVSGLPQVEDHNLVVEVLREFCDGG